MQLLMDGYSENKDLIQNEEFLRELLTDYPSKIGMTRISEPQIIRFTDCEPEEWGISGFVFLAESHIAIHTFVERSYVNIDVFSCKDFDSKQAIKDLQAKFELNQIRSYLLKRGLEYSHAETLEMERL